MRRLLWTSRLLSWIIIGVCFEDSAREGKWDVVVGDIPFLLSFSASIVRRGGVWKGFKEQILLSNLTRKSRILCARRVCHKLLLIDGSGSEKSGEKKGEIDS